MIHLKDVTYTVRVFHLGQYGEIRIDRTYRETVLGTIIFRWLCAREAFKSDVPRNYTETKGENMCKKNNFCLMCLTILYTLRPWMDFMDPELY